MWSGMSKPFAPKCPWLGKIRPCNLLAGCKLLGCLFSHLTQFPHLLTAEFS